MKLVYLDRASTLVVAHQIAGSMFPGYAAERSELTAVVTRLELLDSALGAAQQPYHRTRFDKAGALLRSLIKNHPLADGNKRLGMAATYLFLLRNDVLFMPDDDAMVAMALRIAASSPPTPVAEIANWIRENSLPLRGVDSTVDSLRALEARDPAKLERWLERGPILVQTTRRALDNVRAAMKLLEQS